VDVSEPPFFIVGSARSGTTLLRLILNAHPEVAVPPESRFITELWRGADEVRVEPLLAAIVVHDRFEAWDVPIEAVREELPGRSTASYAEVITAPHRAYARLNGKTRWGDKTPRYVEHIPFLGPLLVDARFIHLIRDGRNVALSYADVPFGPKTMAAAARLWAARVSAGIRGGRPLGERYLEVRYEDLVEDAEGETKSICSFLGLEFDPGMLDYTERARAAVLPRASMYNPHVTERPMSKTRSWEQDMPDRHVQIFEAIAGGLLSELGYPRRHPHPPASARLRAALGRLGVPVDQLKSSKRTEIAATPKPS
jgi:sulfotransferase family protein